MQCSIVEKQCSGEHVNMKTVRGFKNPKKKESNLDNIVDQLCTRLEDIKDKEKASLRGMPTCSIEQTEAVRRYYAAFPALKKDQETPLQYCLPPPAWCRQPISEKVKMQSNISMLNDWNSTKKKHTTGKERRNSYNGQKKNRKRYNSYSKSFESKENLPEWMTHEGVWDMETQDPVREFIRAMALDEGYGTCENTVAEEVKEILKVKFSLDENMVPDWDSFDIDPEWVRNDSMKSRVRSPVEAELYAKFEAKFDRSIEALWSKDQTTPDVEHQELPIDFQDLLSSPTEHFFTDPSAEKYNVLSLTESIWSNDTTDRAKVESVTGLAEGLHDRFRPLNIDDVAEPKCPREIESFTLYEGDEFYEALSVVASKMRSFTAINHSREHSGFVEVVPHRRRDNAPQLVEPPPAPELNVTLAEHEDLLTSSRTHFRPIHPENPTSGPRYYDGHAFDIRGELDNVEFRRSESGAAYHAETGERYLEYRIAKTIDYGRLNLTAAQRCPDLDDPGFRLRFPIRQYDTSTQTDTFADAWTCDECGGSAKKMRPNAIDNIWSEEGACGCSTVAAVNSGAAPASEDLSREWEELLSDISAAHQMYVTEAVETEVVADGLDRKRRHSAALRCTAPCSHPHARFLRCCTAALHRPLTR